MGLESGRQKELEKLYKQLEGLGRHSWEPDLRIVLPIVMICGILGSFLGVLGYRWMQLQHSQYGYTTYHERLQNDALSPRNGRNLHTSGTRGGNTDQQKQGSAHFLRVRPRDNAITTLR